MNEGIVAMSVRNRPSGLTLGPRLLSALPLLRNGDRAADIGTDHAYLPIYLIRNGICPEILATDIAAGPIRRARDHIRASGLSDRIRVLQTPGLDGVDGFEPDAILIFGMGGDLISRILDQAHWLADSGARLILQPMTHAEQVRIWLNGHAYTECREILSEEDGKFYVTIGADPGQSPEPMTETWKWLGRLVRDNPPDVVRSYLSGWLGTQEKILNALRQAGHDYEAEIKKAEILKAALSGIPGSERGLHESQGTV